MSETATKNTPAVDHHTIVKSQREFFNNGETRSYSFRKNQLRFLKSVIENNENEILQALEIDLGKTEFESYASEIGFVYEEIDHALKNLKGWMKRRRVHTPLTSWPSGSFIIPQPKGVTLIIAPWNYPFQLLMVPMISSMAAGNTAVLKPSEKAPATAKLIHQLISRNFEEEYLAVIEGEGKKLIPDLMENHRFDHVFFTGSTKVGREIAKMAAPKLSPVTLELGGKSPAVVDKTAKLEVAAKRIAFGKWLNSGQTCVAPDYLLVEESIKEEFIEKLTEVIHEFYGEKPMESESLGHMISEEHFKKVRGYLQGEKVIFGGGSDEKSRKIEPTLVDSPSFESPLMTEEIFGPILPVITYGELTEAIGIISRNPYPLALYVFTEDRKIEAAFMEMVNFGGGAINNTVVHLSNPNLPFGGVGTSGFGHYHGEAGFETFSHLKSVMKTATWFDPEQKYPPHSSTALKLIRRLMR